MRIVKLNKEIKVSPKSVGIFHQDGVSIEMKEPVIEVDFFVGDKKAGKLLVIESVLEDLEQRTPVKTQTSKEVRKHL
jgi:hypothetical protein